MLAVLYLTLLIAGAVLAFTQALAATPAGPGHTALQAELGFMRFRAGDLKGARADSEGALSATSDPPVRGMILYNLGRIAEAAGDLADARRRYTESLAARPNPTVEKRLAGLAAAPASAPPSAR